MAPTPLYSPQTAEGAYQLRYSWTGWPSPYWCCAELPELLESTLPLWERDGLRLLEHRSTGDKVQLLFSATPHISPVFLAARAKGRLDHVLRKSGQPIRFSRKTAVRSLGDNTRRDVEAYIERQVAKEQFADARVAKAMLDLTLVNEHVDLSQPSESARGRYWYNLHLVLVVEARCRTASLSFLRSVRDGCTLIAAKKKHAISRLSVMPDHLHVALRPQIDESPNDVVFGYQNNLAYLLGQKRIWCDGFYVGTFGEYTTQAVRNVLDSNTLAD